MSVLGSKISNSNNKTISECRQALYYKLDRASHIYQFLKYKWYLSDRKYITALYKKRFGTIPNLDNPLSFNEKNNWRKLNDRREIYTSMVDKYKIKGLVAEKCGGQYVFPLYGVWDSPKEINFDDLPDQFVLKVNHAGGVIVCRDKSSFNKRAAVNELKDCLKIDYFHRSREWPYKNVARKIICEKYMGENLTDYKNYCFNGRVQYTFVWKNVSREDGRKPQAFFCGAYDRDWVKSDIDIDYPSLDIIVDKPSAHEDMIKTAEKMSEGIPFVRTDCYIIDNSVFIGEMTFFPWGGFMKFKDEKYNTMLGELEQLPDSN